MNIFRKIGKIVNDAKKGLDKGAKVISGGISRGARAAGNAIGGDAGRFISGAGAVVGNIAGDAITLNPVGAIGHAVEGTGTAIGGAIGGKVGDAISSASGTTGGALDRVGDNTGIRGIMNRTAAGVSAFDALASGNFASAALGGMAAATFSPDSTSGVLSEAVAAEKRKELDRIRTEYTDKLSTLTELVENYRLLTDPTKLLVANVCKLSGFIPKETDSESVDLPRVQAELFSDIPSGSNTLMELITDGKTHRLFTETLGSLSQQLNAYVPAGSVTDIVHVQIAIEKIKAVIATLDQGVRDVKNLEHDLLKLIDLSVSEYYRVEQHFREITELSLPALVKPEKKDNPEYLTQVISLEEASLRHYSAYYSMFYEVRNLMNQPDSDTTLPIFIMALDEEQACLFDKSKAIIEAIDEADKTVARRLSDALGEPGGSAFVFAINNTDASTELALERP
jgi:hypothetical protein